jgi:hypothetical protein
MRTSSETDVRGASETLWEKRSETIVQLVGAAGFESKTFRGAYESHPDQAFPS